MTAPLVAQLGAGVDTTAWARRLLVATHIPVVVSPVGFVLVYLKSARTTAGVAVIVALGIVIAVLQVRHSIAAARGRVPAGWPWTLAGLVLLAYVPIYWYGISWGMAQTTVIASGLMLLRPRYGVALTALVLTAATVISVNHYGPKNVGHPATLIYNVLGGVVLDLVVGVALFGAARLVRVLAELDLARADLADLAVGRERLRVSRDLHDLLGQSLSAVSLKGDLALRLLERNPPAARAEIQGLTEVAREALHGVRAITTDGYVAALSDETARAAELLRAAGIDTTVRVDVPALSRPLETVLAWTVREGATNILRHSRARNCAIRAGLADGMVWLEIRNDGVVAPAPKGNGLTGLAGRAAAVNGVCEAEVVGGLFRLRIDLPEQETT